MPGAQDLRGVHPLRGSSHRKEPLVEGQVRDRAIGPESPAHPRDILDPEFQPFMDGPRRVFETTQEDSGVRARTEIDEVPAARIGGAPKDEADRKAAARLGVERGRVIQVGESHADDLDVWRANREGGLSETDGAAAFRRGEAK